MDHGHTRLPNSNRTLAGQKKCNCWCHQSMKKKHPKKKGMTVSLAATHPTASPAQHTMSSAGTSPKSNDGFQGALQEAPDTIKTTTLSKLPSQEDEATKPTKSRHVLIQESRTLSRKGGRWDGHISCHAPLLKVRDATPAWRHSRYAVAATLTVSARVAPRLCPQPTRIRQSITRRNRSSRDTSVRHSVWTYYPSTRSSQRAIKEGNCGDYFFWVTRYAA